MLNVPCWMLDVRCWMWKFDVGCSPSREPSTSKHPSTCLRSPLLPTSSLIGRTSMEPTRARGMFEAISMAL